MIFYEAPHKLLATLQDMLEVLGDRPVALVRELTKLHEEAVRTTLSAAAESYAQNPPRGEFVLIVGGAPEEELITVDQYAAAARTIADALHKQGVKVYAGLILPREVNHLFPPEREALRRAINRWIAEEGPFDAVLDLGAPIADTDDGVGMKKEFALPDGLHPNLAGGRAIAEAIDLSLFA